MKATIIPFAFLALLLSPLAHAQEFDFIYPDEDAPLPAGEEFPFDDGVETQGIIPRIIEFFRNFGARDDVDEDDFFLEPEPVEEAAPAVSYDPNDPEKKPRGTIIFGWAW